MAAALVKVTVIVTSSPNGTRLPSVSVTSVDPAPRLYTRAPVRSDDVAAAAVAYVVVAAAPSVMVKEPPAVTPFTYTAASAPVWAHQFNVVLAAKAAEEAAKEAAAKAAKAEAEKFAAIKEPKYDKDILPVFKQNCIKCHGKEKPKGKFRLDTFVELQKGADGEPVIIAKKPDESTLYKLINLPVSDEDRMPNKGDALSKPVIDLVRRWIEQGGLQK